MTAEVIDGRKIAKALKADVALEVDQLGAEGIVCGLATVAVGDDFSASAYQRRLERMANELGVPYRHVSLAAASQPGEVLSTIHDLNADPAVPASWCCAHCQSRCPRPTRSALSRRSRTSKRCTRRTPGCWPSARRECVSLTAATAFHVLDTWLDNSGEDRAEFYHRSLITVVGRSNNVGNPAVSLAYDRDAAVESVDVWASRTRQAGLAHAPRRRAHRRGRRRRADPVRARARGCCGP